MLPKMLPKDTRLRSEYLQFHNLIHPATIISPKHTIVPFRSIKTNNTFLLDFILKEAPKNVNNNAKQTIHVNFNDNGDSHKSFTTDAKQCYAQTLAFLVTGDQVYALNAIKIITAWINTCTVFKGDNAPLLAAWGTSSMARSCEILKYTYPQWQSSFEASYIAWVKKLLSPHLRGETEKYKLKWGFYNNWHTSITEARLQFALLCNDITEINFCIQQFITIFDFYINDSGLTYESFRDSDHNCFGLAGIINICEILFHQNIDLFSYRDNVLLKCIELHAAVYASNVIPKQPGLNCQLTQFNVYKWIQPSSWEIVYNHFVNRCKKEMPYTKVLLNKIRPCKYELHWGYDTITHGY
jgi:hypothetical protein